MELATSKTFRRSILLILYQQYLVDPMRMVTPTEILEEESMGKMELAANSYYLHERGFIELLVGYSPPLFAAARISAEGIDLIEDQRKFDDMFATGAPVLDAVNEDGPRLVVQVADEVAGSGLSAVRKEWLLRDLQQLRDELRKPAADRSQSICATCLRGVGEYFDADPGDVIESFAKLRELLTGTE